MDDARLNAEWVQEKLLGDPPTPLMPEVYWQQERGETFIPSLMELLPAHWREAGRDHAKVPMDVDWPAYLRLEKEGKTIVVTGRADGKLVAYHVFTIQNHINYKTTPLCSSNVYYVDPLWRGRGFFRKMVELGEFYAREREVVRFIERCKPGSPTIGTLESMGYRVVDIVLEKTP